MTLLGNTKLKERKSNIWQPSPNQWFVEPPWVGRAVAEAENFEGVVCDPCCGRGNIAEGIRNAGGFSEAFDLVDRGYPELIGTGDFLTSTREADNFFFNPPFDIGDKFALHALKLSRRKVAMVYPLRRYPAAHKWIAGTPLFRVWHLTPRPSMPPGAVYEELKAAGKLASGGKQDFIVLVWLKGFEGHATVRYLHRDRGPL